MGGGAGGYFQKGKKHLFLARKKNFEKNTKKVEFKKIIYSFYPVKSNKSPKHTLKPKSK